MSEDMNKREDEGLMQLVTCINKLSFLTPQEIQRIISQYKQNSQNQNNVCKGASKESIEWTDKRQGIVLAEKTQSGGILLGITAKAAGFVIGPHGSSIRDICMKTNVWSTSWLSHFTLSEDGDSNTALFPLRMIIIEGVFSAIEMTIEIIQRAVDRYTALVQGSVPDVMQKVSSEQIIDGIKFEYKPPPLTEMNRAVRTTRTEPAKRKLLLSSKSSGKFSSACSDSSFPTEPGTELFTPRQHVNLCNQAQIQAVPANLSLNPFPYPYQYQNPQYQSPYIVYQSPRQQVTPYYVLDYDYIPNPEYVQPHPHNAPLMYPNRPPYMYY